MIPKGKQKNQTVRKSFTIVITNDDGYEVDRRTVYAESPREAILLAYKNIFKE